MKENEPVMIDRTEEIRENIRVFDKLSPSRKIRYVEAARRRLKYYRTLKFVKDDKQ